MSAPLAPVRVRFAPSPTGFLHIGGVRTALFNYLYAHSPKNPGGKFLLRIEDTDLERSEERFTRDIQESMKWLGLEWDEEPVFQSARLAEYRAKTDELISKGWAYRCTCTEAEVEKMRESAAASGKRPQYDRTCRDKNLPESSHYVVRAKIPLQGSVAFTDLIRGEITVQNSEIDDFVLIRSNGATTYNLSVVIDDVFSCMTHIIRGDDHINNTPKQIHLYQFFNFPVPLFAHLPMILGADKKKLSKRNNVVSAHAYRAQGYLPEALVNFLARLGWSHGDQEVFTLTDLKNFFDFDHVTKSSGVFNSEKLLWINGEHIKKADPARLIKIIEEDFTGSFQGAEQLSFLKTATALALVKLIQPKVKLIKELADQLQPFSVMEPVSVDASGLKWQKDENLKTHSKEAALELAKELASRVGHHETLAASGFTHDDVGTVLKAICDRHGIKMGDFTQPLRLAITGKLTSAAGLFDLFPILPWRQIEARLKQVAEI